MKYLFFYFGFSMINSLSFAQTEGLRYGLYFGAGQSKIKNASIENQIGKPAFNAGLISNYQITNNFGLVAALLFTSKGSRVKGSTVQCCQSYPYEEIYKVYYAEVPVMIKGSIQISNLHLKLFQVHP